MNERIKKLLEQAGVKYVTMPKDTVYEKFAELIVRECCEWIDGAPATESGQLLLTKTFIIANLKDRFGVEE